MIRLIYISWRKKPGDRRYIIAKIKRSNDSYSIEYLQDYEIAQKEGLVNLLGIKNKEILTSHQILDWLSLRVISKERPDREQFLKFWEAEKARDLFDIVGFTQGKTPTDNFEFLADYFTSSANKISSFVTDLAGLSHSLIPSDFVEPGDILHYKREPSEYDKDAVGIYKGDTQIGYIKKIHNRIFKLKRPIKLTVKAVEKNGILKQVFVLVSMRTEL